MGGEPTRERAAAGGFAYALQRREDARQLPRVIVLACHVADTKVIRLTLIVTAELQEGQIEPESDEVAVRDDFRGEDRAHAEADLGRLRPTELLRRVPAGDMSDLVSQNPGELCLRVEVREDSARHVDEAAGQGEGVHHRVFNDLEAPR